MKTIYRPVVKSILDSLTPEGKDAYGAGCTGGGLISSPYRYNNYT